MSSDDNNHDRHENLDEEKKQVNIKLIDNEGLVMDLRLKPRVRLEKIMKRYASETKKNVNQLKMSVRGRFIDNLNVTIEDLNLTDGDELEIMGDQVGGR